MAKQKDIRDAYFRKGWNISQIGKAWNIDRKTVRKYIHVDNWNEGFVREAAERETIMEGYKQIVLKWLTEDRTRRRKQRHTAQRVYTRLVEEHDFSGSYRTVANHVANVKKELYQECSPALPLEHKAGEAQADFGEADWYENGKRISGSYLTLSFPSSNAGFLQLTYGQNAECLFEGLLAIFYFIGGVPSRIWFDNASAMVKKVLKGGGRELTDRFLRFTEHMGFEAAFCNPAAGNEKGNVENKVGYLRRNYLVPEPKVKSIAGYNRYILERCQKDLDRNHYRKDQPIVEMFQTDRKALMPLPRIPFEPARYETLTCDAYGMVSLEGGRHRYSTSPRYAGGQVHLKITATQVIILDDSLRPVVSHQRLYGTGKQQQMDWLPYLTQLSRRPGALKYTPIYELLPDPLQMWIGKQSKQGTGKALGLIAQLAAQSNLQTACKAVSDALSCDAYDIDSLVAMYDRITKITPLMPDLPTVHHPASPNIRFDASKYDRMLQEVAL